MTFVEPPECIVCKYEPGAPCEISYLRGALTGVNEQASATAPGGQLMFQSDDGADYTILLQDRRWLALLPISVASASAAFCRAISR